MVRILKYLAIYSIYEILSKFPIQSDTITNTIKLKTSKAFDEETFPVVSSVELKLEMIENNVTQTVQILQRLIRHGNIESFK